MLLPSTYSKFSSQYDVQSFIYHSVYKREELYNVINNPQHILCNKSNKTRN